MSNIAIVEQARKEAKRLLKIARTQGTENPHIQIHNLHEAKEIVARLQGYPGWKAFEDAKLSNIEPNLEDNLSNTVSNLSFEDSLISDTQVIDPGYMFSEEQALAYENATNYINFKDNFEKYKNTSVFKYRIKNETRVPLVKKNNIEFKIGKYREDREGLLDFIRRAEEKDLTLDHSILRSHLLMAGNGSSYYDRMGFLSNMLTTQMKNGDPLIYMSSVYDTDTLSIFKKFYESTHDNSWASPLRCLYMGDSTPNNPGIQATIDPFDELSIEDVCLILLHSDYKTSDYDVWYGRAQSMLIPVMRALFELRQRINLVIDVPTVEFSVSLEGIALLYYHPFVSQTVKIEIERYLKHMPGQRFTQDMVTCEPTVIEHHGYLSMQIYSNLLQLRTGYQLGYFSTEPTDSIRDVVERNLTLYCVADARTLAGNHVKWLEWIILSKIRYVFTKQMASLVKTDSPLKMIVLDDIILGKDFDISTFLSMACALKYSCIFTSCSYMFNRYIDANTCTKIVFNLSEEEVNKDRGPEWSSVSNLLRTYNLNDDFKEKITKLKDHEYYYFNSDQIIKATQSRYNPIKHLVPYKYTRDLDKQYTIFRPDIV